MASTNYGLSICTSRISEKNYLYGEDFEKNADTIQLLIKWMDEFPLDKRHIIVGFLKNTPTHILLQYEAELAAYMPTGYFDVLKIYNSFEADEVDDYEPLWEIFGELLAKLDENFDVSVFFTAKLVQDILIRLGEYDESEYILRDELIEDYVSVNGILAVRAVGVLQLNKEHPLLEQWRTDVVERNEQFEKDMESFNFKAAIREKHGKVGRNDPCVCGSGKKFKKCCGK